MHGVRVVKRIITAMFRHETNRQAPGLTDFQDFTNRYAVYGEDAVRQRLSGARNEVNAFLSYFDGLDGYCIQPVLALNASPGAVVAQRVFDDTCARLLEAVKSAPQVDGILLCLHGAMVTETSDDGEGVLLKALRNAVGLDVPIMATLDLHANVTPAMVENATALFAYYNNPHTDSYETGLRAAKCLHKTLEGKLHPVMAWQMQDLLLPVTPTAHPAMAPFREKAMLLSNAPELIDVSICHGFYLSDIRGMGLSVLAVSDGNPARAQSIAQSLAGEIFNRRKEFQKHTVSPGDAARMAIESECFPLVLADVADNPGCGASMDGTGLLHQLLAQGATGVALAAMYDPEAVALAEKAGVGSTVTLSLGGKVSPERTGGSIEVTAYVKAITDGQFRNRDEVNQGLLVSFGKCALLAVDGVQIIVCSVRTQPLDLEVYRHIGIHPEDMKILVVKSAAHFRASFSKVAARILEVNAPGLAAPDPESAGLTHVRRPIYPLDEI